MHTPKTKSKTHNSPNIRPSFSCPPPVQCGGGRWPGNLAHAPQDYSTTEAFSPKTVLTENICRCVQHLRQHFPTTTPFLTTPTITLSCLASAAHQADSWWLGHVEPDDVVIADIAGQALDIFLHGPEYAHKNGILKTFTHTSIPIQPRTLQKKGKKRKKKNTNSPNMLPSFSCPLPVQCGGGRLSASLAPAPQDFSTSKAFLPRTVLTENICRCVQHLHQHFPTTISFLTTPTITFPCLASAAHQADSWWLGHVEPDDVVIADIAGQALDIFLHGPESAHKNGILKTYTHTSIPIQPRTLLKTKKKKKKTQLTKLDAFV